jgi:IMP cyclohydrolase
MKITSLIKPGSLIVCRAHCRHLIYWRDADRAFQSRYVEKDKVALVCDVARLNSETRHVVYECTMLIDGRVVAAQGTHLTWKEIWEAVKT